MMSDGPFGAQFEQASQDIAEGLGTSVMHNRHVIVNRVLREFLARPDLLEILAECGIVEPVGWWGKRGEGYPMRFDREREGFAGLPEPEAVYRRVTGDPAR